ncbi:hypothetical protein ACQVP2_29210 [Methylobacterium aquaticum]|uniref:hypothetical protein n=1 Tax=Methylobacterium aquaticum TaxID=270351 RepID=UPI003D16E147
MDTDRLAMIVNGYSRAMMVLIDHLSARGIIDRENLSESFRKCAFTTLRECEEDYKGDVGRIDFAILNSLADQIFQKDSLKAVYKGEDWSQPSND